MLTVARGRLEDERDQNDNKQNYEDCPNAYVHLTLLLDSR